MVRGKILSLTVLMAALFAGFVLPDQAEAGRCGCRQRCHRTRCCHTRNRCGNNCGYAYAGGCGTNCTTGTCNIGTTNPDGSMAPAPAPNAAPAPAPST